MVDVSFSIPSSVRRVVFHSERGRVSMVINHAAAAVSPRGGGLLSEDIAAGLKALDFAESGQPPTIRPLKWLSD